MSDTWAIYRKGPARVAVQGRKKKKARLAVVHLARPKSEEKYPVRD